MPPRSPDTLSAGDWLDDYCRPCKAQRRHTVTAVASGMMRVMCDFCGSQHNYRGNVPLSPTDETSSAGLRNPRSTPLPLVSDRERTQTQMSAGDAQDLELLLRRIIREEAGITPVPPADKWRGGTLVLKPGKPGLQEKSWPIETLFHKIVMIRNRLRTLEQHVNAADLPEDLKVRLQGYVTGCYGSLTSFNVLFAEESDKFKGAGGDD